MYKFKKQLPVILLSVLVFTGLLVAQVVLEYVDTAASKPNIESQKKNHFESLYNKLDLVTLKKNKIVTSKIKEPIVILNFWASWCTPCLVEFPSLMKMVDTIGKDKIKVIGINTDVENQLRAAKKTIKSHQLNFENVLDVDSKIVDQFNIETIPVSLIFHQGKLIEISKGEKDFMSKDFLDKIKKVLTKSKN